MVNAMLVASATASNRAFIDSPQALRASRRHGSGLLASEPTGYPVITPAARAFICSSRHWMLQSVSDGNVLKHRSSNDDSGPGVGQNLVQTLSQNPVQFDKAVIFPSPNRKYLVFEEKIGAKVSCGGFPEIPNEPSSAGSLFPVR